MTLTPHISEFTIDQDFSARHIGPREDDVKRMLEVVGYSTLDELVDTAVPQGIRMEGDLQLPEARTEMQVLQDLRNYANQNVIKTQMIGQGFSGTLTPRIILRKVLENPAWYTAYTPYQPEISQGRLEALLNFQTAVQDLTGLPIANASMLDEASAVAEAVLLMRRANKKKEAGKTVIDQDVFPQNLAVVKGRAEALGFEVEVADLSQGLPEGDISGVVLQQPGDSGRIMDYKAIIDAAHERGALVTVAADILSLTLIKSPGEQGADIAVGNTQRLGVPLFFGGPHAAFFAVRDGLERQIPGRLVGVSKDDAGRPAYRLALQTREQHIRREKATSNICTAQALLAITASMYVVYHGPAGLKAIAQRTHQRARALAALLAEQGVALASDTFFDTVRAKVPGRAQMITTAAEHQGINIRLIDQDTVSISTDELTTLENVAAVAGAFGLQNAIEKVKEAAAGAREGDALGGQNRESDFLTHPIFNSIKSETQMLRYLRKLSDRDLALDRTMIPLGSCTMKLNAATEMESISWPGFADIHPFAPESQTAGWRALITDLESRLTEITGYAGVSIQPNAGSQGEYAGLLAIRQFHLSKGDTERDIVLIPASAHGTNAASAVLAGLRVVVVKTASDGTIDSADLDAKVAANEGKIAAIMITYPSTHGVYDADVTEVCRKVHEAGGQVYIDGANMNALVGLAQPGKFGGDVSHLNLHKTFCIPHGGGGPGVGPVAVAEHLVPFLPGAAAGPKNGREGTPVTATTYGSAGVLPISWAYVALMGAEGLRQATKMALLNANYISKRLSEQFPTLYTGNKGLVAHECILDLRELTAKTGVTAEDVCKRLIDYGFHAPTLAFPVAGTLMVEPTESEDLGEIDRFIDAMIAIKAEMDQVLAGDFTVEESPLRNAPHTTRSLMHGEWDRKYTREQGAFPGNVDFTDKYFPPVGRIDGAFGDRNLVCECPPPEAFDETN